MNISEQNYIYTKILSTHFTVQKILEATSNNNFLEAVYGGREGSAMGSRAEQ